MSTQTKKSRPWRRIIIITSLALALITLFGGISFAWIRNYIEVNTARLETGKMLYNFTLYRVENGQLIETPLYDTKTAANAYTESVSVPIDSEKANINVSDGEELFFVVEKYNDSINFDVSLSFDNDGLNYNYDNIGSLTYAMKEDRSEAVKNSSSKDDIKAYITDKDLAPNDAKVESLGNIWKISQRAEVTSKFACIRIKIAPLENLSAQATGLSFPIKIKLCAAQSGALPEELSNIKHIVSSKETLETAMNAYRPGDELYVEQSINYTGDLVFTRPCTLTIVRSELNVTGNVIFSYMYEGEFGINTVTDGQLKIKKNEGSSGSLLIDLPNASMKITGANDSRTGEADIYVENEFKANASKKDGNGLSINYSRICDGNGEGAAVETLKPMQINGSIRLYTALRTNIGAISTTTNCKKFTLENNGSVAAIDLTSMSLDSTLLTSPAIYIRNAGSVTDEVIKLPLWSYKFNENDLGDYNDNTKIVADMGSSPIKAVTGHDNFEKDKDDVTKHFFSNGNKGLDDYRDDIVYNSRVDFVEKINNDPTKIIIHYETIANPVEFDGLKLGQSIESLVEYYNKYVDDAAKRIGAAEELTYAEIICYDIKALTEADYTFIRSMSELTELVLSDAVSENKIVPTGAFKDMKKLEKIKMSESDIQWNENIFVGTKIEEIWFPQSLRKLNNPTNSKGTVTAQNVLKNIKYVHTSISVVEGLYCNTGATQYLFTPDEHTYSGYRNLMLSGSAPNPDWADRIFRDATRYGDYFLRNLKKDGLGNNSCEFVTYVGDKFEKGKEAESIYKFDFININIDGDTYEIVSYEPFAFYNKLRTEVGLTITFGENLESIGEYSFANQSSYNAVPEGLTSVEFLGNTEICNFAFFNSDNLLTVQGANVTTLSGASHFAQCALLTTIDLPKLRTVEGAQSLSGCPVLQSITIGVIEKTSANSNFYDAKDENSFARFYINTDGIHPATISFTKALASNYRFIFVHGDFAHLYTEYRGLTSMGKHTPAELMRAGEDGSPVSDENPLAYYYVVDDGKATLVACLLDSISVPDQDYTTISSFNDGINEYPVVKIGSSAYQFTAMKAKSIKISNDVKELGAYSFDASKAIFKKYCPVFDLNNVEIAYDYALYYMDMVKLVGSKLKEVRKETISRNLSLAIAELPNLARSREQGSTNTPPGVFDYCEQLRYAYVGVSEDITYNDSISRTKNYIKFANTTFYTSTSPFYITAVNTIINTTDTTIFKGPNNRYCNHSITYAGKEFENVVFSDWYAYEGKVGEIPYSFELPTYIYTINDDSTNSLTLIAVSPDMRENPDIYVTPNELYKTGETDIYGDPQYTAYPDVISGNPDFIVSRMGDYAYSVVALETETVKIGSHTKVLGFGALKTDAYNSTGSTPVLNEVKTLDLVNVESIGNSCIYSASITELRAFKLKKLDRYSISYCNNLSHIYLPAYISSAGNEMIFNNASLTNVSLGKYAETLPNFAFRDNKILTNITILRDDAVVECGTELFYSDTNNKTYVKNAHLYVPQKMLNDYLTKYSTANGYGKLPTANIHSFGFSLEDANGTIYSCNALTDTTANINYIDGLIPTGELIIPSSVTDGSTEYTITSISAAAIQMLDGVTSITLPDSLSILSFKGSDLPSTVTSLAIAESNGKFSTKDGVLYSEDGSILFIYPKGKTSNEFIVGADVTSIAKEAFYEAKNLNSVTVKGCVSIGDMTFAKSDIHTIRFESNTPSKFEGKDIILDADVNLVIIVPADAGILDLYKNNVWVDLELLDKFRTA